MLSEFVLRYHLRHISEGWYPGGEFTSWIVLKSFTSHPAFAGMTGCLPRESLKLGI
jgi:hypothetical protein